MLADLPPDCERIDIDALLREGGTGHPGSTYENGEVDQELIPERYIAHAKEPDSREIGPGEGASVGGGLLRLWRPPAHMYSDVPPFAGWDHARPAPTCRNPSCGSDRSHR